jgi:hypothetical protein
MELNILGPTAGAALFLGVWVGHVLVRKLEYNSASITFPAVCFGLAGIALEISSFFQESALISAMLGILGITFVWDSLEFFRQQKRVITGHAPANPRNPRHARILAEYPQATTLDLLKRDPAGREVSLEEAILLVGIKEYDK